MSLTPASPASTRQFLLSMASACLSLGFPWSVNTKLVRLLHSLAHVSIQTPSGVLGSQGREGWEGQTLPRQSSHWTGHQPASQGLTLPFPPTPTQVEGEQLSPEPMLVKVSAQHGTNISGEPEGIQHWE